MPDIFFEQISSFINKQITLVLSQKSESTFEQIDATYTVYLSKITRTDEHLEILCTPVGNSLKHTSLTIKVPLHAHFSQSLDDSWKVSFPENSLTRIVKFIFPKNSFRIENVGIPEKPSIKEVKDASGRILRLYVTTPAQEVSLIYLSKIKELIESIFRKWYRISISEQNITHKQQYNFKHIEILLLPGNPFFEATFLSEDNEVTVEIPATFKLDIEKSVLSFKTDEGTVEFMKA